MYFPELSNGLATVQDGVVALSRYDRAFLLSVVNVARFWGTLTNEQQAYIEALENKIMADDITILLEEIRDAITASGGGGTAVSTPTVTINPVVSLTTGGCGCPEDVGLLKLAPCLTAKGTGGSWDSSYTGYYRIPVNGAGGLYLSGMLEAGSYSLKVEVVGSGEDREFGISATWGGGGVDVGLFFYEGYSPVAPFTANFTIKQRSDFDLSIEQAVGFDPGATQVRATLCKVKTGLGGRHSIELETKPTAGSTTGQIGGFTQIGYGAKIKATPIDTPFTTINVFDDSMAVYKAKFVFHLAFVPDLGFFMEGLIKTWLALAFPPIAAALWADAITIELFGVELVDYGGEFVPEKDGITLTIDVDIPVEGIPGLVTDPASLIDMFNIDIDFVNVSTDTNIIEFMADYASYFFIKWAKLVIDTGAITP